MCKRIIWGNSIYALLKKWIIIGPLYEIQVNVVICMYIVINVFSLYVYSYRESYKGRRCYYFRYKQLYQLLLK